MRKVLCLLTLGLGLLPVAADDKPIIGRLFTQVAPQNGNQAEDKSLANQIRMDGIVMRSSRLYTVWINGAPTPSSDGRVAASKEGLPTVRVRLSPPDEGPTKPVTLQVGQAIDLNGVSRRDIVPPGSISIRRGP